MANTLTAVTPKLLAAGLMALRQNAIMPRLVNRKYEEMAGEKGSTIDVPIPSAIAVQTVSPSNTPPTTADVAPTSVAIPMDQWKEAPFYMTDKDILEAMNGTLPMQASEAVKALANTIDADILSQYVDFYGFRGTESSGAHINPFADSTGVPTDTRDGTAVRAILNKQLAPMSDRQFVLGPDAEGNALNLRAFQDLSWTGDPDAIIAGKLNQRLGFSWWMDQNVPTHVAGTAAAASDVTVKNVAGYAIGSTAILLTKGASTCTLLKGDILTFSGDTQTYVVTDTGPLTIPTTASTVTVNIQPPLVKALVDAQAVDVKPSHQVNLAFHPQAIAFASRPLVSHGAQLGVISQSMVDAISGLALRLEITHEHKRVRWSFDALWGKKVIRREYGCRLAGALP